MSCDYGGWRGELDCEGRETSCREGIEGIRLELSWRLEQELKRKATKSSKIPLMQVDTSASQRHPGERPESFLIIIYC